MQLQSCSYAAVQSAHSTMKLPQQHNSIYTHHRYMCLSYAFKSTIDGEQIADDIYLLFSPFLYLFISSFTSPLLSFFFRKHKLRQMNLFYLLM